MNFLEYANSISPFSLDELKNKTTFSNRINYCKTRLQTLAHGSARVVFLYGSNVLKVAKNNKGLEQNQIEAKIGKSENQITTNLIIDGNGIFNVFKKADQITMEEFESIVNMKMSDIHTYLKYTKDKTKYNIPLNHEKEQYINENESLKQLCGLIFEYNLSVGDLIRISSWGKISNNAVLVDFGLTSDIYKKYYKG